MVDSAADRSEGHGLAARSANFLAYLDTFVATLPVLQFDDIVATAGGAHCLGLVAVDLVGGFCEEGALASARVGAIVEPTRLVFDYAWQLGARTYAVLRDEHRPDAPEFTSFPPHCVAGTPESRLVSRLADRPWARIARDLPKNSLNAWMEADGLQEWVTASVAAGITTVLIAGDCTDLCVYQTAMSLRLWANAMHHPLRVIVPATLVATYDLSTDVATTLGAIPHDGDLLHAVFLYHLRLNGVEVVGDLRIGATTPLPPS